MGRWWYRRMAWKNDPGLFMDMHPRLSQAIDALYEPSWPIREWLGNMSSVARDKQKIQAIRDVHGDRSIEVKYWKFDGNAAEIYREGRERGWTGERNSVKPYSRRELVIQRLVRVFKHDPAQLDAMDDAALFDLLDKHNHHV